MKKIVLALAFLTMLFTEKTFAQDSTSRIGLSHLLQSYYGIKDALVAGNASAAATQAEQFIKTLNAIDYKVISEGNAGALLKDATPISESKDLAKQRSYFADLSTNMAALAKAVKLSDSVIYLNYCPMKKAGWLSADKPIKNPYFGTAMLGCGSLVETFQ